MARNKRLLTALVMLALLIVLVPACGKSSQQAKTIKVGVLHPVTGEMSNVGVNTRNGWLLAFDEVNAGGGIKSMGGTKIEPVLGDSQGKAEVGISEVERLVNQEKVALLGGCYQSAVTVPATAAAERLKTPFVVDIATSNKITERGLQYTFRVGPKGDWYDKNGIEFLLALKDLAGIDVKKVALLRENTDVGESNSQSWNKWAKEFGLEVVIEVSYASNAPDLTTEVSKVAAAKPDAVLMVTYPNDAVLIQQARTKLGLRNLVFLDMAGGTIEPEFIQRLGDQAEGAVTMVEFSKFAKGSPELNDRFSKKFGTEMSGNSYYSYQAGLVVADVLERAASTDKELILKALLATDMSGAKVVVPGGRIQFDENHQNKYANLYVVQVQNHELTPIWPEAAATGKFVKVQ